MNVVRRAITFWPVQKRVYEGAISGKERGDMQFFVKILGQMK
jgi:hypothetical protein